ncbi:hypothetical protein Tco_1486629, partial [Tanacetum coccineum]
TPANALVITDGMGYDWSYQAEKGPIDFALIAHSSSGSSSSSSSDIEVSDNSIIKLKNQLEEALKEKDDLKLKLEKFETSFKKLTELINSQISFNNKTGVGFDSQMNEYELHDSHMNKSEVFKSASDSSVNESEVDDNPVNDRFKTGERFHAVPPPYTRNYMPPRPDLSFAGLNDYVFKSTVSETITVTSVRATQTNTSKTSKESMEKPKTARSSASLIEEWESNSDDDYVIRPSFKQNKHMLTNSSKVPVNNAKQSFPRLAVSNSTARYVNTAASRPTVNDAKPSSNVFHKSHSSVKRTFNQRTAPKTVIEKKKLILQANISTAVLPLIQFGA